MPVFECDRLGGWVLHSLGHTPVAVEVFRSSADPNAVLIANVCVSAVAGIGGLSNGAKRNAKADQLRSVPRHNLNKETESNEDTEPRHCRNILLGAVYSWW